MKRSFRIELGEQVQALRQDMVRMSSEIRADRQQGNRELGRRQWAYLYLYVYNRLIVLTIMSNNMHDNSDTNNDLIDITHNKTSDNGCERLLNQLPFV